jgi:hypothetical protein
MRERLRRDWWKAALVGAIAAGAVALVGSCDVEKADAPSREEQIRDDVRVIKVKTDDRTVTCAVYESHQEGGISCDWEGSTRGNR